MQPVGMFANLADMDGGSLEADALLIRSLIEWSGLTANGVAKRTKLAASTINRHANGSATTRLGRETIAKLRAAFPDFPGFNSLRPDLPIPPRAQDYVPIRVLPSYAGMGGGGTGEGDITTALVARHLIEDEFRGRPDDFELINVRGDSMQPLFDHGDQLLIDKRDRNPVQPGPFAIFDGDAYVVKLVERVPGKRGWYRVFSANERYSESETDEEQIQIMGRPVWFARRL